MKSLLYDTIARSCLLFSTIVDSVARFLVNTIVKLLTATKISYASFCMFLLKITDKKRLEIEKEDLERGNAMLELALMQAAVRIKESAVEHDEWTQDHSNALNMVGIRLIEECDWEADSVHKYLKPLVESVPGLEYEG